MKISHLSFDIGRQISQLYSDLMYEKCLSDTKIVQNTLSLAKLDKDFAFLYLNRPGHLATVRSQVLYLHKCAPQNVSHRETNECYQELPVLHNNRKMFMSPKSRILLESGEEILCSQVMPSKFLIDDQWFTRAKGQLIPTTSPTEIKIEQATDWNYTPMRTLTERGIYSKKEVEEINRIQQIPLSVQAETSNFISSLRDAYFAKFDTSLMYSDNGLLHLSERLKQTVWTKFKTFSVQLGDITSFLIGVFLIIKFLKSLAGMVINGLIIGLAFGFCNYRILFSCWNHAVSLILHRHNMNSQKRKEDSDSEQPSDFNMIVEKQPTLFSPIKPSTSAIITDETK